MATNPYLGVDNPYLTQKIDQAQGDLVRNYNLTTQPAYNTAQVQSGSFGNSGVQQLNENAQANLQKSLGDVSTNLRGQDYQNQQQMYQWDQNFDRTLYNDAFSQQQQGLQTQIGLLGTLNGYNQQDLNNGTTIQNTPMNYYGQFANYAGGLGNGYGTSTSTGSTSGGTSPVTSALGGAQLANSFYNNYNSNSGNGNGGYSYNGTSYNNPSAYTAQFY